MRSKYLPNIRKALPYDGSYEKYQGRIMHCVHGNVRNWTNG